MQITLLKILSYFVNRLSDKDFNTLIRDRRWFEIQVASKKSSYVERHGFKLPQQSGEYNVILSDGSKHFLTFDYNTKQWFKESKVFGNVVYFFNVKENTKLYLIEWSVA